MPGRSLIIPRWSFGKSEFLIVDFSKNSLVQWYLARHFHIQIKLWWVWTNGGANKHLFSISNLVRGVWLLHSPFSNIAVYSITPISANNYALLLTLSTHMLQYSHRLWYEIKIWICCFRMNNRPPASSWARSRIIQVFAVLPNATRFTTPLRPDSTCTGPKITTITFGTPIWETFVRCSLPGPRRHGLGKSK